MYEVLTGATPYNDYTSKIIPDAKISFCMIYGRPHFFILVEDNTDKTVKVAFSYVPESTKKYIDTGKGNSLDGYNPFTTSNSLDGYNPFTTSNSYVVNAEELTNKYIRLFQKNCKNWKFKKYKKFNRYNVLTIIPREVELEPEREPEREAGKRSGVKKDIIIDCIGYSLHHYKKAI
jgi:hypothetical protein